MSLSPDIAPLPRRRPVPCRYDRVPFKPSNRSLVPSNSPDNFTQFLAVSRNSPFRDLPEFSGTLRAAIHSARFVFDGRRNMAQLYFHCSNSQDVLVDQRGTAIRVLAEARDHAACVVRSLITARGPEDGATGPCTSATISMTRFLPCRSPPCSASRTERSPC